MKTLTLINPHNNHSISEVLSRKKLKIRQVNKFEFIYKLAEYGVQIQGYFNDWRHPETPKKWDHIQFLEAEKEFWVRKYNIKSENSQKYECAFISTKDLRYGKKIFGLLERFKKILVLVDDHLFAVQSEFESLLSLRFNLVLLCTQSLEQHPIFGDLAGKYKQVKLGWEISQKFKDEVTIQNRYPGAGAFGTLTYRNFPSEDLMKDLQQRGLRCVHPEREFLYENKKLLRNVDVFIPKRDFTSKYNILKKVSARVQTQRYNQLNLNSLFNYYRLAFFPPIYNHFAPLGLLEAISSGCVIVGSDDHAYSAVGFKDNVNYISVGDKFTVKSINSVIQKNVSDIDKLRELQKNSFRLLNDMSAARNLDHIAGVI